jgi:hypothetical protein
LRALTRIIGAADHDYRRSFGRQLKKAIPIMLSDANPLAAEHYGEDCARH